MLCICIPLILTDKDMYLIRIIIDKLEFYQIQFVKIQKKLTRSLLCPHAVAVEL